MATPTVINIHHAKTHLSRIVEEVAAGGNEVIIAKAGRPVAKFGTMIAMLSLVRTVVLRAAM